jgi:MoaA/NifB/PqqE/SkfB family radical SAM enzyme
MTRKDIVIGQILHWALNIDQGIPIKDLRLFTRLLYFWLSKEIKKLSTNLEHTPSEKVAEDLYYMMKAMLQSALRVRWTRNSLNTFVRAIILNQDGKRIKEIWRERYGEGPPGFLVISPTKFCNLSCPNCYANAATEKDRLEYWIVQRIVREARKLWGVRFFVLSGGEPFAYQHEGKGILDLAREFDDCVFMAYTNGTLINEKTARILRDLGNLTPAISVEGFEETTDKRRGKGMFSRILQTMERLKRNKVLFGISLTATRYNCKEILSDEFIDFFFNKMGASYGWIFHYMPIGRDIDISLMPTPKQRLWMWERSWEIVKKKGIMLADFWNHGTVSHGCIAGGREGGYLHINWHGDIAPCVFFPFAVSNIRDIYAQGGTIEEAIRSPFFEGVRDWQKRYGFFSRGENIRENDWLRPCPIRDHFLEAREVIQKYGARPIDYAPHEILTEKKYIEEMASYDRELENLIKPIWERIYANHSTPH